MTSPVPLTLGFANLVGEQAEHYIEEDIAAFGAMFRQIQRPPVRKIPHVPILFAYAWLNDDGTIKGTSAGIRQIVEVSGCKLLVMAMANSGETMIASSKLPGPKTANIIFTNNRNGPGFARFFREMFELMRGGMHVLQAYVWLAPQGPVQEEWLPGTIVIAEAGKMIFPEP